MLLPLSAFRNLPLDAFTVSCQSGPSERQHSDQCADDDRVVSRLTGHIVTSAIGYCRTSDCEFSMSPADP